MTQTFVVGFEVAHLSVLMVWRLQYPDIPTLNGPKELCSALHIACILGLNLEAQVMAINSCEAAWYCLRIMEE